MFWKKNPAGTDSLTYSTKNQRESYRYDFKDGKGFQIEFKKKPVWVLNISAGGLSFHNQAFEQFDSDFIKFTLDIPNFNGKTSFFAGLRILRIDKENVCHCIFERCPLEQHELIHKYVLEMQKHDLAH